MAEALSIRTALPGVSPGEPDGLLGNSTETCISRGIAEGASGAVRRLFERAAHAAGSGVRVMVTGGTGRLLLPALPSGAKYRQELALEGLGLASLNAR